MKPAEFADERFGVPTVTDILGELEKPGRDPRPAFTTATFAAGVEKVSDLQLGMVLEGVVTNVAAFGAFVDVGVHQDGLVHVSAMANRFVSDPHEVVKSGQVVKVKVVEVDVDRQRIGLSLRLDDEVRTPGGDRGARRNDARTGQDSRQAPRGGAANGRGGNDGRSDRGRAGNGQARGGQPRGGKGRDGKGRDRRESQPINGSMAQALRDAGFGK
ncbi:RNA-binding protein [Mycobacteroides abscessus subsp. abscessus]|nr:RNA-binding protein [Mycobacteroides abscessus subsp. abscessus]